MTINFDYDDLLDLYRSGIRRLEIAVYGDPNYPDEISIEDPDSCSVVWTCPRPPSVEDGDTIEANINGEWKRFFVVGVKPRYDKEFARQILLVSPEKFRVKP